jgi:isopenicillin-N epimerase
MSIFGRSMLKHGRSIQSAPTSIMARWAMPRRSQKQQAFRDEMERQPSRFMLRELGGIADALAVHRRGCAKPAIMAAFLGARPDDLVRPQCHDRHERGP